MVVGHFAPQADGVALSCAQFFVAGLMTLPIAFLTEHIPLAGIWEAKWALLYAGVLSCGVAYTLQIVGQKDTPPAIASLSFPPLPGPLSCMKRCNPAKCLAAR